MLVIIVAYIYGRLVSLPYVGMEIQTSNGTVTMVFQESHGIEENDRLIEIGGKKFSEFQDDLWMAIFEGVEPDDTIPITLERNGETLEIDYVIPGPTPQEVRTRVLGVILVAIVFWIMGTLALIYVRPRDLRWRLLTTLLYLTAVVLVCGSLSSRQFWGSAILLRMSTWFLVPVYLQFHWIFPKPLRTANPLVWGALYTLAGVLAVLEFFQFIPPNAFYLGIAIALAGSVILIFVHVIYQPEERRDLKVLSIAATFVMVPLVLFSLIGLLVGFPELGVIAIFALPFLPGAYLYTIFRHQIGGLEFRANRVISIYLFGIVVGFSSVFVIGLLAQVLRPTGIFAVAETILAIGITIITIAVYPRFQRWMEFQFLGIPRSPVTLVETYAEEITTNLDRQHLVHLLTEHILPSLEIRQSALITIEDHNLSEVIFREGIKPSDLPGSKEIQQLIAEPVQIRTDKDTGTPWQPCPWVILSIPLNIGGQPIGLWLLGRRDPEDFYPSWVITDLQMIGHQTAIALVNIVQTEQLSAFYRSDIDRQEAVRVRFARWLHDDVLSEVSALKMNVRDTGPTEAFDEIWQGLVNEIRDMIPGIRPVMLTYGLGDAIVELGDSINSEAEGDTFVQVQISDSACRYGERVEGHLFRIVQEACRNAISHADASTIQIQGDLASTHVDLLVEDDGCGFEAPKGRDLASLLTSQHYGLVSMHERASLIGANLQIQSDPGDGCRVHIFFELPDQS